MGKFTIEQWRCDRCHIVKPKWLKPLTAYSIRASVAYDTAGGAVIDWIEMCAPCCDEVGKQIEAMKASALEARKATPLSTPDAGGR